MLLTAAAMLFLTGCAGRMNVAEKMMWSTYPIATMKGEATSFVIQCDDRGASGAATVFTPAHVLETMGKGPLVLGLHRKGPEGGMETVLLMLLPEGGREKRPFYVRHPTQDLAAFRVRLPEAAAKIARLDSVLKEQTLKRGGEMHVGDEVSFLGYPNVCPGTKGAFAVLRRGTISSYPAAGALTPGMFLIGADVYPGDSGAPVFTGTGKGSPRLVGVLTSRLGMNKGAFSHLAVALDMNVVRETAELLRKAPPLIVVPAQ